MNTEVKRAVSVMFAVFFILQADISLAAPSPVKVYQPVYGFEFYVYRTHDMPANWYKTYDDYYVIKRSDGNWVYGKQSGTELTSTAIFVGTVNPAQIAELNMASAPSIAPTPHVNIETQKPKLQSQQSKRPTMMEEYAGYKWVKVYSDEERLCEFDISRLSYYERYATVVQRITLHDMSSSFKYLIIKREYDLARRMRRTLGGSLAYDKNGIETAFHSNSNDSWGNMSGVGDKELDWLIENKKKYAK